MRDQFQKTAATKAGREWIPGKKNREATDLYSFLLTRPFLEGLGRATEHEESFSFGVYYHDFCGHGHLNSRRARERYVCRHKHIGLEAEHRGEDKGIVHQETVCFLASKGCLKKVEYSGIGGPPQDRPCRVF